MPWSKVGDGRSQRRPTDFHRLFSPSGIAIIGASTDLTRIGGQPLRALTEFGYQGNVYPVNPKYKEIKGLPCYPDVGSVPQPCDVALVAVPATHVAQTIDECRHASISFAVVLSAGFRELGERGAERQRELDAAIARGGIRVVGPNSVGILNLKDRVFCGFGAGFQNADRPIGSVAMVSQSGGSGTSAVALAEHAGLAFAYTASTGNETDVTTLDLLAYFLEQDDVDILVSYMEGIRNGRHLIDIGRRALAVGKPILVWKVGNSEIGRRAATSHTANLTASYELYRAAFREGGFIEVRDVDDIVDIARAFRTRRLPKGNGVAVLTVSGGAGVLLADRCTESGLTLPQLSDDTVARLRTFVPEFASLANPVDLTAQGHNSSISLFNRVIEEVRRDPSIHQIIIRDRSFQGMAAEKWARELVDVAADDDVPIHVAGGIPPGRGGAALDIFACSSVAYYLTPGRAALAAGALSDFADRRRCHVKRPEVLSRIVERQDLGLDKKADVALSEYYSKRCLKQYGIPVVRGVLTDLYAIETATRPPLPFPVVLKVDSPDIPHKTEAGGVRLNIRTLEDLKLAARAVDAAARRYRGDDVRLNGLLVEEMVSGLEVIVGAVNDAYFGPTVIFGLGGVFTEILRDVSYRFAPFDADTARQMILEIRSSPLLMGYRGQPALDINALADIIARVSLLIADHADRIAEIDINPVFVRPMGQGAVAADALVVLRELHKEGAA